VVVLDKEDVGVGMPEIEDEAILVEQLQQHHEVLIKDISKCDGQVILESLLS
jgi:hypothetical protein